MTMIEGVLMGLGGRARRQEEEDRITDAKKKRRQDDEDRAFAMDERAFTMSERARAAKLRDDMGAVAAPAVVDAAPTPMPIGSRDEVRAPEDTGTRVNGKTFTSQADVQAATAAYDAPQAVTARMADVSMRNGDPLGAQNLRTGAMQEQASKYTLDAAERADIKAKFVAQVQPLGTFEQLEEFVSRSGADGMGGAIKVKMVLSPDGKSRVVHVIAPDGTLKPTEKSFENSPKGFALAKAELEGMPAEKMLAHLHTEAVEARAVKKQADDAAHQQGMLKATQDKTAASIEIATMRADMAAQGRAAKLAGAGGQQPAGINMGEVDKFINPFFTTGGAEAGSTEFNADGALAVRGLAPRMPAALNGDSQGAANQAMSLYKAEMKKAGGDHNKAMSAIYKKAADLSAKPAGEPAAAPPIKPAAIPVDPNGPKAPAALPSQPGMVARVTGAVKGALADGAETGRQTEAIRARLMDAGKGGAPLTPAERATAKKYGFTPTV